MRNQYTARVAAVMLTLAACQSSNAEHTDASNQPAGPDTAQVTAGPPPGAVDGTGQAMIRDVRVRPGSTTVEISFTAPAASFAAILIGPDAPVPYPLSALAAGDSPLRSVLIMDPETQVAGYIIRSGSASYRLDTARDSPEEGSTNGPPALRAGTTYHYVISVPVHPPRPGDDEDEMVVGAQYAGSFTTLR